MPKIRIPISLNDPQYFCNVSWTLSYNMNTKSWVSFHSYLPNFYIAENNFFYSGINNCCEEFDFLVGTIVPNPPTTTTTSTSSTSTTTTTSTTVAPPNCNFNVLVTTLGCQLEGIGYIVSYDCELNGVGYIIPETTSTTSTSTTTTSTTTQAPVPCGSSVDFSGGQSYPSTQTVTLGTDTGVVYLTYDAYSIPDRFIVKWNNIIVIDTGYRGDAFIYDFEKPARSSFTTSLIGKVDPVTLTTYPDFVNYPDDGYPRIVGSGSGAASFNKNLATSVSAIVDVYGPMGDTAWEFALICPQNV